MGSKGQVEPVDPYEVGRADAMFNRIDQYTPYGQLEFSGPERNRAHMTLSPQVAEILQKQLRSDTDVLDLAGGRMEGFEQGLPELVSELGIDINDPASELNREKIERAMFDRGSGLLEEYYGRARDDLTQSLANRGLQGAGTPEITEGAFNEYDVLAENERDAVERLALDSVLAGGSEQDRMLNAQMGTTLTDANLRDSNRSRQFNELAALLGLQQVAQPGLSNFFAPGDADVVSGFAMQNQGNMANAANATSTRNALLGGLSRLGSAAIMGP